MNSSQKSIILVGMPGAGKSTLGIQLAKKQALNFVDTDLLIQLHAGSPLQTLLDDKGYLALRAAEEKVLLDNKFPGFVVATGGSAVYSDAGMQHLKRFGAVVFLDVPLDELRQRIDDYETRGIAKRPDQSFTELFEERLALYKKYADITIECGNRDQNTLLAEIMGKVAEIMGKLA
jgi:shikimate kinase